jgi:hypothetical protein
MQSLRMIIEMRTYKIKLGLRAEFLEIFESKSLPSAWSLDRQDGCT